MIRLEEFGLTIPRPGWPGRRRAILLVALKVLGLFIVAGLFLVALEGAILVAWAMGQKP